MTHMEKSKEGKRNHISKVRSASWSSNNTSNIWDCGSTLYDSYELNSFKTQIDSAIATSPRTISMPHLQERPRLSLQPQSRYQPAAAAPPSPSNKYTFKISRPFQKLLRFVFKSTNKARISSGRDTTRSSDNYYDNFQMAEKYSKERLYVVYDKSDQQVLSTIPELPEFETVGGLSPEISSLVRKSASERFSATAVGISCS